MRERDSNSLKCGNYNKFVKYYTNLLRRFKTLLLYYFKRLFILVIRNILKKINLKSLIIFYIAFYIYLSSILLKRVIYNLINFYIISFKIFLTLNSLKLIF